jgi:hypothetical protein
MIAASITTFLFTAMRQAILFASLMRRIEHAYEDSNRQTGSGVQITLQRRQA